VEKDWGDLRLVWAYHLYNKQLHPRPHQPILTSSCFQFGEFAGDLGFKTGGKGKIKNPNLILQSDTTCHFLGLFGGFSGSWLDG
jgi:hypothetical protein